MDDTEGATVIGTQQREQRATRAARPVKPRPEPRRAPELAHLSLTDLRAYRQDLVAEETRISYWRRIVQARLDLVIDGSDRKAMERLREVLDEHADSSRRLALLPVASGNDAPPLPNLTVLWETTSSGCGDGGCHHAEHPALVTRLAAAEDELSTYRRALHDRLDAATGELIARYRDQPALALDALPRDRRRSR